MRNYATIGVVLALLVGLLGPWHGARGQSDLENGPQKRAEDLAREGMDKLLKALEQLLQAVPQYEPPIVNKNGDIIIRRKHPPPAPGPEERPQPDDQTRT